MVLGAVIFLALSLQVYGEQRETVEGDQCGSFPQTYKHAPYQDCFQANGKLSCYTIGGLLKECISQTTIHQTPPTPTPPPAIIPRATIDGRSCIFPYTFLNTTYYDCIPLFHAQFCRLDNQWTQCAQTKNPRITYQTYYENINMNPNNASYLEINFNDIQNGTQSVFIASPTLAPSHPSQRYTIDGKKCDDKYEFNGVEYSGCIIINGLEYCEVSDYLKQCEGIAGSNNLNLSPQMDENLYVERFQSPVSGPRVTTDGVRCEFPIIFRQVAYMDCIVLGGKEQCLANKKWEECASISAYSPESSLIFHPYQYTNINNNTLQQYSNSSCVFPFEYQEVIYNECVYQNGTGMCFVQNVWKHCLKSEKQDVQLQFETKVEQDGQQEQKNMIIIGKFLWLVLFVLSLFSLFFVYVIYYLRRHRIKNNYRYQDLDSLSEKEAFDSLNGKQSVSVELSRIDIQTFDM